MVVSNMSCVHPYLGKWFQFKEHIFSNGWFNHHLVTFCFGCSPLPRHKKNSIDMFRRGSQHSASILQGGGRISIYCVVFFLPAICRWIQVEISQSSVKVWDVSQDWCFVLWKLLCTKWLMGFSLVVVAGLRLLSVCGSDISWQLFRASKTTVDHLCKEMDYCKMHVCQTEDFQQDPWTVWLLIETCW